MTDCKILQLQFYNPNGQTEAAQKAAWERAHQIAIWPGLVWKVWIFDPVEKLAGGIYLFQDEESARAYLQGPVVAAMKAIPGVDRFQAHLFSIDPARSATTRAPVPSLPDLPAH